MPIIQGPRNILRLPKDLEDIPLPPSNLPNDLEDVPITEGEDSSFLKDTAKSLFSLPNLVRMGGSTAADIVGGIGASAATATGVLAPAAPYIYGGTSFAGGYGSEALARWMEGKEFDNTINMIEGAANLMPGPNIPGKGAGIKEIGKFAAKSAGYGAAQGAIGATPRKMAEEHKIFDEDNWSGLNLPSAGDVVGQAGAGAVGGGVIGGALGAGHVAYKNRRVPTDLSGLKQQVLPGMEPWMGRRPEQMDLPFDPRDPSNLVRGDEDSPTGGISVEGLTPEAKGQMSLGIDPIGGTQYTGIKYDPYGESAYPIGGPLSEGPRNPPPPPSGGAPIQPELPGLEAPTTPETPPAANITSPSNLPETVTVRHPDKNTLALLKSQGYVSVPGLRDKDNFPMMVRGDVVDKYKPKPSVEGLIKGEQGTFDWDDLKAGGMRAWKQLSRAMWENEDEGIARGYFEQYDRQLKELQRTGGSADDIEQIGSLRDDALDRWRHLKQGIKGIPDSIREFLEDESGGMDPEDDPIVRIIRFLQEEMGNRTPGRRMPMTGVHGDEAIPYLAVQPDEGKYSSRESLETVIPPSEGGTGKDTHTFTRQEHNRETDIAPERTINDIAERFPEALSEARRIYSETDPQRISENLRDTVKTFNEIYAKYYEAWRTDKNNIPPELERAYYKAARLHNLAQNKYERAGRGAITGQPESMRDLLRKFLTDETGSLNLDALRDLLRRVLGREPNDTEVQQAAFGQKTGELTGRVGPVIQPESVTREPGLPLGPGRVLEEPTTPEAPGNPQWPQQGRLFPPDVEGHLADPQMVQRIKEEIWGAKTFQEASDNVEYWANVFEHLYNQNKNTDVVESILHEARDHQEGIRKRNEIIYDMQSGIPTFDVVDMQDGTFGVRDLTTSQVEHRGDDRAVADDIAKWWNYQEPHEITEAHQPIPPRPGQQELPGLMGRARLEAISDAPREPLDIEDPRFEQGRDPRQGDLIDQMDDAEIAEYLRNEDATPPEMTDIGGLKDRVKQLGRAFIEDERGELNPRVIEWLREKLTKERGTPPTDEDIQVEYNRLMGMGVDTRPENDWPRVENPELERYGAAIDADMLRAPQGEPIQSRLDMDLAEFNRPTTPAERGEYGYPYTLEDKLTKRADIVAQRMEDARAAEAAGDIPTARQHREEAARGRNDIVWDANDTELREKISRADEVAAVARIKEASGDLTGAARFKALADSLYKKLAGQLELNFIRKKIKSLTNVTPEQARESQNSMVGEDYDSEISHTYAQSVLRDIQHGPPGLEVEQTIDLPNHKEWTATYRNPQGRGIGEVRISRGYNGRMSVGSFVIDKNAGLLSGRAAAALKKVILQMDAARPNGSYSRYTKNAIQRLMELPGDEEGALHIGKIVSAFGDAWDKIREFTGIGQGLAGKAKPGELNWIKEALAVPSAATTTADLSAPGRQGLSMILTPQFWKATYKMFGGLTAKGFDAIDADLRNKPIFKRPIDPRTGLPGKSFAEEIGMKLFEPASKAPMNQRAQGIASRWLETGGNIPLISPIYRNTAGVLVRGSNRGYITFLNHLNANRTEFLLNKARDMSMTALTKGEARPGIFKQKFTPQQAMDLNPYTNLTLAKEIAEFVNTATGHAPLKTHLLPFKQAELNLEKHANGLASVLFSPGLLFSRVRMLNPNTYIMASPFVRKQYMKAALGSALGWFAFTELAKMAGGDDAEVNNDWTSADFGKVRIGDTRFDFGGGFLQFATLVGRMVEGGYTSSSTGEFHEYGQGFQAETRGETIQRFISNKLNPAAKFAYDLAYASEYNPFHVQDRIAQLFVPLAIQDIIGLAQEDPELLPWMAPVLFGGGTQTYGKGESRGKLVDEENDILYTGGRLGDEETVYSDW